MELAFGILVGLFILVVLVVVHELGHAIVARRNGVVVEEFGVGFPPKAWGKKIKKSILGKNVLFSLNWLPLGGFVKLQGENDAASRKGDYGAAGYWPKTRILLAGVLINWLTAVVILTGLAFTGMPKILPNQFAVEGDSTTIKGLVRLMHIVKDSPADKAGFETYDYVVSLNGEPVDSNQKMIDLTKKHRGESVEISFYRGAEEKKQRVTLKNGEQGNFGASLNQSERMYATWSAPLVGFGTTLQFTAVTFQGLGQLITDFFGGLAMQLSLDESTRKAGSANVDKASQSVAGPIGILAVIFPSAQQAGLTELMFLTAVISLTLAVMNVLPIPALDGGRWFLMTLYRLRKKELTKEIEEKIVGISFMILLGLIILVTIADVGKIAQ